LARTTYNRNCARRVGAVSCTADHATGQLITYHVIRHSVSSVTRGRAQSDGPGDRPRRPSTSQQLAGGRRTRRPERVHDAGGRSASEPNLRAPAINPAKTRRHRRCAARRAAFSCRPRVPESFICSVPGGVCTVQQPSSHRHSDGSLGHILTAQAGFSFTRTQHTPPKASDN